MKQQAHRHHTIRHEQWHWPVDITSYDRHALLYPAEQEELAKLIEHMDGKHNHWPRQARTMLHRLVSPLEAALDVSDLQGKPRTAVMLLLLRQMHYLQRSLWGWNSREWLEVLLCKSNVEFHQRYRQPATACRQHVLAVAYLLGGFIDFGSIGRFDQSALAKKVFGSDLVDAAGEPWRFFDLGHGYCLYEFFDACPHRMACARCSFYCPKGSTQAQLLGGKANLLHTLQAIPLSEEERAAVEDGIAAMEQLCQQLADVPTPAGPTPNQLVAEKRELKTVIPVEKVRRKR